MIAKLVSSTSTSNSNSRGTRAMQRMYVYVCLIGFVGKNKKVFVDNCHCKP